MLTEVLKSSSVERLRGILRNRYGKGLKVSFMVDVSSIDPTAQSPSVQEGDLRIPISTADKYLATAIVPGAHTVSAATATQIADLVQMVLTPALLNWHARQQEHNLMLLKHQTGVDTGTFPGIKVQAPTFLLESKSAQLISKAAIQIHEISERWAFLRWRDIQSTLKTITDIKELGAMTVLIEDILTLSAQEQEQLIEYLVQADLKTEPLFLVGSTLPLHEILAKSLISEKLASLFQPNRLELDRMPQTFSQMRETLELVLDRTALLN